MGLLAPCSMGVCSSRCAEAAQNEIGTPAQAVPSPPFVALAGPQSPTETFPESIQEKAVPVNLALFLPLDPHLSPPPHDPTYRFTLSAGAL